jgi:hypothetical protein
MPKETIVLNNVTYNAKEIKTAIGTAISIKPPKKEEILDDCDALEIDVNKIVVFKTEGKLKVVAKPPEGVVCKGFVMLNKHTLKSLKSQYVNTEVRPLAPTVRYTQRPDRSRSY